ncbi:SusC/RagA family TonB-linked outer membrane protein [Natronogracilivirga saccharolytica]|uniref:SusC/RagA family TonB-linked outer membrane protein n=1 Tax=Natronogracilivirga saccharolytica TaxID=2812953 RepID=A0A8J7RSI6_9BACT|nr:SusC/RagA family TonB-linked outer membrane protein [Natronogracilivirga saccharolytica]MBP3192147.1 SusC/RagA family TonB-linked outer membrane protein [Natronogracilivirga saccharolytica]
MKKRTYSAGLILCLILAWTSVAEAQTRTITGTVYDAEDESRLPGVNIVVEGTTIGTTSDTDGNYELEVPEDAGRLVFSFIGFETRNVRIADRTTINVRLSPVVFEGDDVVVTAMGMTRQEKSIGYTVQQIDSEDFLRTHDMNPMTSLQGRVANVDITGLGTGADGSARIIIRGHRSLRPGDANQPLIIVDGMPIDNSGGMSAGQWGGFDYGTGLNQINPNDIESINILQGPNAAALYGSRAANGAVIITTKSGRGVDGIGVEYTSNVTFERPAITPDFQNEFGRGSGGTFNDYNADEDFYIIDNTEENSWGPRMSDNIMVRNWTGEVRPYSAQSDHVQDFFRTGVTSNQTITMTGGGTDHGYRLSYTNMTNQGIYPDSEVIRNSISLRAHKQFSDRLRAEGRFSYVNQDGFNRPPQARDPDNPVKALVRMPRSERLEDLENFRTADGLARTWDGAWLRDEGQRSTRNMNPYWAYNLNINDDERDRAYGFAQFDYNVTDWMSVMVRGGLDFFEETRQHRRATNTPYEDQPSFTIRTRTVEEFNVTGIVTVDRALADDWTLEMNVGGNYRNLDVQEVGHRGIGLNIPEFYSVSNAETVANIFGISRQRENSVFGSAQIGFRNYAFLEATNRVDWVSTLPVDNLPFIYPSLSATLVWSEAFGLESETFTFGRLRLSAAEVGAGGPAYLTNFVYTVNPGHFGQPFAQGPGTLPAIDLKPEIARSYEIGLDLRFFEGRLSMDMSAYTETTRNQILSVAVTKASGHNAATVNAGEIQNRGFEAVVSGIPLDSRTGWRWDSRITFGVNRNEIRELHEDVTNYFLGSIDGAIVRASVGDPFGDIVGTRYKRNEDGRRIIDNNGIPVVDDGDHVLGNFNPDWTGGFSNNLRYRNFGLSTLIDISYGGEVYSLTNALMAQRGNSKITLEGRSEWYAYQAELDGNPDAEPRGFVADGVIETTDADGNTVWVENDIAVNPQTYWSNVGGYSPVTEEFIYDATYVRFRELAVSYFMPPHIVERLPIVALEVSAIARNLFYIYKDTPGFSPAQGSFNIGNAQGIEAFGFPETRSVGFNINVRI